MKEGTARKIGEEIAAAMRDLVSRSLAKRDERLTALEKRVADIELQTKNFRYTGVWERDRTYQEGNFATFAGSLWSCKRVTTGRPGDSDAWQLCAKAGRDGRDAAR
jgi:hypothetical protein